MGRPIEDYKWFAGMCANYTIGMFKGNEPQYIEHEGTDGIPFKKWFDRYSKYDGTIVTHGYEVCMGDFGVGNNNSIYFNVDITNPKSYWLEIIHNTGDLKMNWTYHVEDGKATLEYDQIACKKKPYVSEAKLRKILDTKNSNPDGKESIAWKLFIAKAKELFELGDWKGEYRDL